MANCVDEVQISSVKSHNKTSLFRSVAGLFKSSFSRKEKIICNGQLSPYLERDIGFGTHTGPSIR
ncbi:hypothetical protein PsAD2_01126 [Pseudovibrio axinellae]|uniref:Uncharacterized protein n=1 Tax=Pseudovibrio axinellae TaxID=989403 RepID=A0A166A5H3_9HYPH|nr:hypothetical protein PsAD2_01126 [Pseudovibrio axinellae]SER27125.1 hypothetical protein SAMN05421798_107251 [Pseudovibrio axinellae]